MAGLIKTYICYRLSLCTAIKTHDIHTEVAAGIFWKQLPDTITYEATIPITYIMEWQHDTSDIENKTDTCKNSTSMLCYMENHILQLSKAYEKEQDVLQESWEIKQLQEHTEPSSSTKYKRALDFIGKGLEWCCGVATQAKLSSLVIDEKQAETEINQLHHGLQSTVKIIENLSKDVDEYQGKVGKAFEDTNNRMNTIEQWLENFKQDVTFREQTHDLETYIIMKHQIEIMKKLIRTTRSLRQEAIINKCKMHQIPIEIVHPKKLAHDLKKLQAELAKVDQGLAIPKSDFARYYQLQICECTFTEKTILIHIKIPVRQKYDEWQLFELITTPFAWYNQTCTILHNPLYLATSDNTKTRKQEHRQITGSRLHYCKPYNEKLCYLPRYAGDLLQGPACARSIFQGASVKDISHNCQLSCHPATQLTILEIEEETYMLAHVPEDLHIECNQYERTNISHSSHSHIGALKILLPCNCQLEHRDQVLIPRKYPCKHYHYNRLKTTHVIPATWTNLKSFILNPTQKAATPTFKNAEDCLNHKWTMEIPHVNLTSTRDAAAQLRNQLDEIPHLGKSFTDTFGEHANAIMVIWNLVLTVLIIWIIRSKRTALIPIVNSARADDSSNHEIHFAVTIAVFALCMMAALYAIIRLCIKNRQLKKKERLNACKQELKIVINSQDDLDKLGRGEEITVELDEICNHY